VRLLLGNHTCLCLPAEAGTHLPTPYGWKAEWAWAIRTVSKQLAHKCYAMFIAAANSYKARQSQGQGHEIWCQGQGQGSLLVRETCPSDISLMMVQLMLLMMTAMYLQDECWSADGEDRSRVRCTRDTQAMTSSTRHLSSTSYEAISSFTRRSHISIIPKMCAVFTAKYKY